VSTIKEGQACDGASPQRLHMQSSGCLQVQVWYRLMSGICKVRLLDFSPVVVQFVLFIQAVGHDVIQSTQHAGSKLVRYR
jgi:hypothetical protein